MPRPRDSAYCAGTIVTAIVKTGARFSITIARNPAVDTAIAAIRDDQSIPVPTPAPSSTRTPAS